MSHNAYSEDNSLLLVYNPLQLYNTHYLALQFSSTARNRDLKVQIFFNYVLH